MSRYVEITKDGNNYTVNPNATPGGGSKTLYFWNDIGDPNIFLYTLSLDNFKAGDVAYLCENYYLVPVTLEADNTKPVIADSPYAFERGYFAERDIVIN